MPRTGAASRSLVLACSPTKHQSKGRILGSTRAGVFGHISGVPFGWGGAMSVSENTPYFHVCPNEPQLPRAAPCSSQRQFWTLILNRSPGWSARRCKASMMWWGDLRGMGPWKRGLRHMRGWEPDKLPEPRRTPHT